MQLGVRRDEQPLLTREQSARLDRCDQLAVQPTQRRPPGPADGAFFRACKRRARKVHLRRERVVTDLEVERCHRVSRDNEEDGGRVTYQVLEQGLIRCERAHHLPRGRDLAV